MAIDPLYAKSADPVPQITEVFVHLTGPPASGKTQLICQMEAALGNVNLDEPVIFRFFCGREGQNLGECVEEAAFVVEPPSGPSVRRARPSETSGPVTSPTEVVR